jgi:hypothetical protein
VPGVDPGVNSPAHTHISTARYSVLYRSRRLILTRHRAQADGNAIPSIDGGDGQRQIHQLLFIEMLADLLVHFVRRVVVGNKGQCVRPGEGGPFAVV